MFTGITEGYDVVEFINRRMGKPGHIFNNGLPGYLASEAPYDMYQMFLTYGFPKAELLLLWMGINDIFVLRYIDDPEISKPADPEHEMWIEVEIALRTLIVIAQSRKMRVALVTYYYPNLDIFPCYLYPFDPLTEEQAQYLRTFYDQLNLIIIGLGDEYEIPVIRVDELTELDDWTGNYADCVHGSPFGYVSVADKIIAGLEDIEAENSFDNISDFDYPEPDDDDDNDNGDDDNDKGNDSQPGESSCESCGCPGQG